MIYIPGLLEIFLWMITTVVAGITMTLNPEYASKISGITYIAVAVAAALGLYLNYENTVLMYEVTKFLASSFILEVFIFLNVVTGFSFYDRLRRHS